MSTCVGFVSEIEIPCMGEVNNVETQAQQRRKWQLYPLPAFIQWRRCQNRWLVVLVQQFGAQERALRLLQSSFAMYRHCMLNRYKEFQAQNQSSCDFKFWKLVGNFGTKIPKSIMVCRDGFKAISTDHDWFGNFGTKIPNQFSELKITGALVLSLKFLISVEHTMSIHSKRWLQQPQCSFLCTKLLY